MTRKKKKIAFEDEIQLIHYRDSDSVYDFKISTVKNLEKHKMDLLLEGKTHIEIPFFDDPSIAERLRK